MHTARKFEDTLDIVNEELPGLSASARLTGLELSDCIVEFSHLGQELTGGLKAGARAMQATEAQLQEGGRALKHTWKNHVVPGISERITASKGVNLHQLSTSPFSDKKRRVHGTQSTELRSVLHVGKL